MTPEQESVRNTWQYRAVEHTRGPQTALGCLVLAILGRSVQRPAFGDFCIISEDGYVFTNWRDIKGREYAAFNIGPLGDLIGSWHALADNLKLNDADTLDMFSELRKWVKADYRPDSERVKMIGG